MLYRVFRAIPGAPQTERGGALYVARDRQGAGRHDDPSRYGAYYAARTPEAAVAEVIQAFRGRDLVDADLALVSGAVQTLAVLDDEALGPLTDLDDPAVLTAQGWRPSRVASRDRSITQPMAVAAFTDGALGLSWWSTLDAAWTNVTLFAERTVAAGAVSVVDTERLTIRHPAVQAAAAHLGIPIGRSRR
jgi:hypothetical protein